jgi:hypothetical protein
MISPTTVFMNELLIYSAANRSVYFSQEENYVTMIFVIALYKNTQYFSWLKYYILKH